MIDPQDIKHWLTETITGVVVLGAFGSIVGAIAIYLAKRIAKRVAASKDMFLARIFYTYGKNVEIGTKIRDSLGPKNNGLQFLVYHINEALWCFIVALAFFFTLTITTLVSIRYGIERPILLSSLIAFNIITFVYLIKSGTQLSSHNSDDLESKVKEIQKSQPKRFSEWLKKAHE